MEADVKKELDELKSKIDKLSSSIIDFESVNDFSATQQDTIRDVVKDKLMETVWNDYFYASGFSPFTLTVSTGSETFERLRDTTEGNFLVPSRSCKLRVGFYFGGAGLGDNATTYITTAHVRTDVASLTTIDANGAEYVGIKIVDNEVFLIAHNEGQKKTIIKKTKETIVLDETNILEIQFFPNERADFFFNNVYVGSISEGLPNSTPVVFYPLFCSMLRSDGTTHILNIDFYEFIHLRK